MSDNNLVGPQRSGREPDRHSIRCSCDVEHDEVIPEGGIVGLLRKVIPLRGEYGEELHGFVLAEINDPESAYRDNEVVPAAHEGLVVDGSTALSRSGQESRPVPTQSGSATPWSRRDSVASRASSAKNAARSSSLRSSSSRETCSRFLIPG